MLTGSAWNERGGFCSHFIGQHWSHDTNLTGPGVGVGVGWGGGGGVEAGEKAKPQDAEEGKWASSLLQFW